MFCNLVLFFLVASVIDPYVEENECEDVAGLYECANLDSAFSLSDIFYFVQEGCKLFYDDSEGITYNASVSSNTITLPAGGQLSDGIIVGVVQSDWSILWDDKYVCHSMCHDLSGVWDCFQDDSVSYEPFTQRIFEHSGSCTLAYKMSERYTVTATIDGRTASLRVGFALFNLTLADNNVRLDTNFGETCWKQNNYCVDLSGRYDCSYNQDAPDTYYFAQDGCVLTYISNGQSISADIKENSVLIDVNGRSISVSILQDGFLKADDFDLICERVGHDSISTTIPSIISSTTLDEVSTSIHGTTDAPFACSWVEGHYYCADGETEDSLFEMILRQHGCIVTAEVDSYASNFPVDEDILRLQLGDEFFLGTYQDNEMIIWNNSVICSTTRPMQKSCVQVHEDYVCYDIDTGDMSFDITFQQTDCKVHIKSGDLSGISGVDGNILTFSFGSDILLGEVYEDGHLVWNHSIRCDILDDSTKSFGINSEDASNDNVPILAIIIPTTILCVVCFAFLLYFCKKPNIAWVEDVGGTDFQLDDLESMRARKDHTCIELYGRQFDVDIRERLAQFNGREALKECIQYSVPSKFIVRKLGVVLVVTKDRRAQAVLTEAWNLEKALQDAGYDILLYGSRKSVNDSPVTAEQKDFLKVASVIQKSETLKGAFIFITTHGYTNKDERPMFCTEEEGKEIDVWEYFDSLSGTTFPVIIGINACRIYADQSKKDRFACPAFDLPANLYVTWGAAKGGKAYEGEFILEWISVLHQPCFRDESIATIADRICRKCRGKQYDGFVSNYPCKNGVFEKAPESPD